VALNFFDCPATDVTNESKDALVPQPTMKTHVGDAKKLARCVSSVLLSASDDQANGRSRKANRRKPTTEARRAALWPSAIKI
jgi:hypothetical protein